MRTCRKDKKGKKPKFSSILEVHEGRNDCMESIMWRSTDILEKSKDEVQSNSRTSEIMKKKTCF